MGLFSATLGILFPGFYAVSLVFMGLAYVILRSHTNIRLSYQELESETNPEEKEEAKNSKKEKSAKKSNT